MLLTNREGGFGFISMNCNLPTFSHFPLVIFLPRKCETFRDRPTRSQPATRPHGLAHWFTGMLASIHLCPPASSPALALSVPSFASHLRTLHISHPICPPVKRPSMSFSAGVVAGVGVACAATGSCLALALACLIGSSKGFKQRREDERARALKCECQKYIANPHRLITTVRNILLPASPSSVSIRIELLHRDIHNRKF